MWAILEPLLIKAAINLAIMLLQKSGFISKFEAAGIKEGTHILQAVRVEDSYPEQTHKNGV